MVLMASAGCALAAFIIEIGIIASLMSRRGAVALPVLFDRIFNQGTTIIVFGPIRFWMLGGLVGGLSALTVAALARRVVPKLR